MNYQVCYKYNNDIKDLYYAKFFKDKEEAIKFYRDKKECCLFETVKLIKLNGNKQI